MGHPDFRLPGKGKIFASLQPDKHLGTVKISLEQQAALVDEDPETFVLFGGFSKHGWTGIRLKNVDAAMVKELVREAFANVSASVKKKPAKKATARRGR